MSGVANKLMSAAGGGADSYWIALLGGASSDIATGVSVDSSKNIVVVGSTSSAGAGGAADAIVTKYDRSGNLLWSKTLGGSGNDSFNDVTVDSFGNIVSIGLTDSDGAGSNDFLIAKYDTSGTLLWDRTLGGAGSDIANGVAVDSSDNIIVVGQTTSDGAGNDDFLIAKYSTSGTLLWDKTLGGLGIDNGQKVVVDSSDNIIVVGATQSDGAGSNDFLIAKYDSSGTLLWDKTLGGTGNDFGRGVCIDSSDNIIVVGSTTSDGAGSNDFLIAKYNPSGTLLWDKTLGGASGDIAKNVDTDSSDNIIVVGNTLSEGAGGSDVLIAKYDSSGTLLWDKTLGGSATDDAYGVIVDSSDNIIVVGFTSSDGAGSNDFLIAKLPADGTGNGTYGVFVYEDAVLTDAAAVLTDAAAVLTDAAAVLTDAEAVLTSADAVLTEELFEIT